jgi:hypothetical protein
MFSTVPESENEGNRKVSRRCAETVEQSKFLWKKKENRVRILNQEADLVRQSPRGKPNWTTCHVPEFSLPAPLLSWWIEAPASKLASYLQ